MKNYVEKIIVRKLWFIHTDTIERGEIEFNHCSRVFPHCVSSGQGSYRVLCHGSFVTRMDLEENYTFSNWKHLLHPSKTEEKGMAE